MPRVSPGPGGATLVALLGLLMLGGAARAAVSVAIVPPVIEEVTRPGRPVHGTIAYRNQGEHPLEVSVSLVDFEVGERNEVLEAPAGTTDATLARLLRVSPSRARVEPGQEVYFRYSLEAPEAFGHLRGMIYFLSLPDRGETTGPQLVLAARLGVPLYLESTTAAGPDLRVEEARWTRRGDGGLVLGMDVTNRGGRIFRPAGQVEVRSADGSFEKTFAFNDGREPVLPGHHRRWEEVFGPVPGGELSVRLLMQTSPTDRFRSTERVAGLDVVPSP